jgi:DNA-binding Lrp family transcriptional regulator
MTTTAIVLMNVEAQHTNRIAEEVAAIPGISEVYSVAGNYDLVAVIRVGDNDALADLVTDKVRRVTGIQRSQTLIAFRAYSRHDLDALFDMD